MSTHPGRLEGKVALITGAAKGLGEADARLFAEQGAMVIVADVDESNGRRIAEEIGSNALFKRLDVTNEDNWAAVIGEIEETQGALHVLINNAGIVEVGNILTTTTDEWRRVNAVSADGTFFGCRAAMPLLIQSGGGSIINMASIASLQGEQYVTAYCAAKGSVEALTRAIAVFCAQDGNGVRCNSIHPSGMDTPMVRSMPDKMASADPSVIAARGPAPSRVGDPKDVAYMALYLASDESKFINGTAMRVDNSMTVTTGSVTGRSG
jgi:3(or 17)beta-hydroxysteroid dehydrogenase